MSYVIFALGVIFCISAVPATIVFFIELNRRRKLHGRLDEMEDDLSALRGTVTVLKQKVRDLWRETPEIPAPKPKPETGTPPPIPSFQLEEEVPKRPVTPPPQPIAPPKAVIPPSPPSQRSSSAAPPSKPTSSSPTFEKRFATQWTTWLGAIALLFSGVFLVKMGIDQGWFGPMIRITMAYAGGALLLGAGEFLRSKSYVASQGCSAGGIAILFAATMASANLYHFIPPSLAILLVLGITITAILLSLRTGAVVAVVGLLGGFLLPIFLRTEHPKVWALLAYLVVIHVGVTIITLRRKWTPLLGLSTFFMVVWGFIYAASFMSDHPWAVGILLLLTLLPLLVIQELEKERRSLPFISSLAVTFSFLVLSVAIFPYHDQAWWMFAILSSAMIFLASRQPFASFAFAALAIVTLNEAIIFLLQKPHRKEAFLVITAFGLLWTLGSYLRHWFSRTPFLNLLTATFAALVTMAMTWQLARTVHIPVSTGILSLGWGLLLLLIAYPLLRMERTGDNPARLGLLLAGATILMTAAVPMELKREWITVIWAVEIPILILLEGRLKVAFLRVLAFGCAALVAIRLFLNPAILTYPAGEHLLFNWISYAYGLSLAGFFLGGYLLARISRKPAASGPLDRRKSAQSQVLYWGARIALFYLVTLLIRRYFHGNTLNGPLTNPWEIATYVHAWFLLSYLFRTISVRLYSVADHVAATLSGLFGLALSILFNLILFNPLRHATLLGRTPVLNGLLYIFGLPILWFILSAKFVHVADHALARLYQVFAYLYTGVLLTLEIRHAFHPGAMHRGKASDMEQYSYSAAWIMLAIATLIGGIRKRSKSLRYTSLAVMMLAVAKVFLFDITALSSLHRALSFLALGVSLFAISILYQKFVFTEDRS